ncbi:bifunctional UDP-4-amino-4-deoxy-L-arabinose formyltransferase/UDP-glucuronic acid oxidase ArnA, partial [Escherichia coli]
MAQTAVPILPDDTAHEVFGKVVVAAEMTLWNVLSAMLAGNTPNLPNDLSQGSYFSGRKPEDGRIDWRRTAGEVHNLVR